VRAFLVRLPSGQRYWTVLDEDLQVVVVADGFLRHQRFGCDGAESTTRAYAHAIALFLRWCARTGRGWQADVEHFGLFMTWLAHAGPEVSASGAAGTVVVAGPGAAPARSPSRINGVLTAVRGMVVHAVAAGQASAGLVALLYEVTDDRGLPEVARGEGGRMAWRMRARHRLRESETAVDRASDEEIVALLRACRSARDRLIVLLMARGGPPFCAAQWSTGATPSPHAAASVSSPRSTAPSPKAPSSACPPSPARPTPCSKPSSPASAPSRPRPDQATRPRQPRNPLTRGDTRALTLSPPRKPPQKINKSKSRSTHPLTRGIGSEIGDAAHELLLGRDAEFGVEAGEVGFDGADADAEPLGDRPGSEAACG
jgi:hypothetical protein